MKHIVLFSALVIVVGAAFATSQGLVPQQWLSASVMCERDDGATGAVAADVGPDPMMSMVCERACAAKGDVDESRLVAQPGTRTGDLTRCPVSGVTFVVQEDASGATLGGNLYRTCCATCVAKLEKHPERFIRL